MGNVSTPVLLSVFFFLASVIAIFYTFLLVTLAILSLFSRRLRAFLSRNKKRAIVTLVILYGMVFLPMAFRAVAGLFEQDKITVSPADQTCVQDSDCIQVSISCGCDFEEVNKIYKWKYVEMQQKLCEGKGQAVCPMFNKPSYVCRAGVCTVVYQET